MEGAQNLVLGWSPESKTSLILSGMARNIRSLIGWFPGLSLRRFQRSPFQFGGDGRRSPGSLKSASYMRLRVVMDVAGRRLLGEVRISRRKMTSEAILRLRCWKRVGRRRAAQEQDVRDTQEISILYFLPNALSWARTRTRCPNIIPRSSGLTFVQMHCSAGRMEALRLFEFGNPDSSKRTVIGGRPSY